MPRIFRDIKDQLALLICTLEKTQSQVNARRISEETAEMLKHVFNGCLLQVKQLEDIMAKTIPTERDSTLNRGLKALTSLARQRTVQHIRSEIDRYVAHLTHHHVASLYHLSTWESYPKRPLFTVEFGRDPSFIGREDIIKEIDERFQARQVAWLLLGLEAQGE
jgi:hypothetical protein